MLFSMFRGCSGNGALSCDDEYVQGVLDILGRSMQILDKSDDFMIYRHEAFMTDNVDKMRKAQYARLKQLLQTS